MVSRNSTTTHAPRPLLQWAMAGLGALVTLSTMGVVVWEMAQPAAPPRLSARVITVSRSETGQVATVEVTNDGDDTAANVDIEGRLDSQTATATLDYVPGHGHARAYLQFKSDPAAAAVVVKGWSAP